MTRTIILKKEIPKGTVIKDLYDDGDLYYLIDGKWYPTDFNDFKHSEFCDTQAEI